MEETHAAAGHCIRVQADEKLAEAGRVWPLTCTLCEFAVAFAERERSLLHAGARLLELGGGTGALACLLALAFPSSAVVTTDLQHVVPLALRTVALNELHARVAVVPLSWGESAPPEACRPDALFLCECLYWGGWTLLDSDTRQPLRATLLELAGPFTFVFIAFTVRDAERELGFLCQLVEQDGFAVAESGATPWRTAVEGDAIVLALHRS